MRSFEKVQKHALDVALEAVLFSTKGSQNRKIQNFETIDKAIRLNIEMLEKFFPLANNYLAKIPTLPNDENAQRVAAEIFIDKAVQYDWDRGTEPELRQMGMAYVRNRMRFLDRADLKRENVQDAEKKLLDKLGKNGEYTKRLNALKPKFDKLGSDVLLKLAAWADKTWWCAALGILVDELNWFRVQYNMTTDDTVSLVQISKKYAIKMNKKKHQEDTTA